MKALNPLTYLITIGLFIFGIISLTAKENPESLPSDSVIVRAWQLSPGGRTDSLIIDTVWAGFQQMNPIYKGNVNCTWLGGAGTAYQSHHFFERKTEEFIPLTYFSNYLYAPEKTIYYNTKKPYSLLDYSSSVGERRMLEQTLRITHTQNITPETNAGFNFYTVSDKGNYKSNWIGNSNDFQRKRSKISSFNFFSSHISSRYSYHGGFVLSRVGPMEEYGGLTENIAYNEEGIVDYRELNPNLIGASSDMKYRNFYLQQELKSMILPQYVDTVSGREHEETALLGFIHLMDYRGGYRLYEDKGLGDYYTKYFIHPGLTADSVYYRSFKNTIRLTLHENPRKTFRYGGYAGISGDFKKFGSDIVPDTLITYKDDDIYNLTEGSIRVKNNDTVFIKNKDSVIFEGAFEGYGFIKLKESLKLDYLYDLTLSGYRAGDLDISTGLYTRFKMIGDRWDLRLRAGRKSDTPNLFYADYTSNHRKWYNPDFEKEKREYLTAKIDREEGDLSLEGNFARIRNYTYIDRHAKAAQYDKTLNIMSLSGNFNFNLGHFYFRNKVLYQTKTANYFVLDLPDISLYNSSYYEFTAKKDALYMQAGIDLRYFSRFYMSAYDPSSGTFYRQIQEQYGDYPFVDVFLNALWKRVRIFIAWEHVNQDLFKENPPAYYTAYRYPTNMRRFKLGISWSFYD